MGKQTEIPGTERKTIADIDEKAEAYLQLRDQWMGLAGEVELAQGELNDVLQKHKLKSYAFIDEGGALREVYFTDPRVKVRKLKQVSGGDE